MRVNWLGGKTSMKSVMQTCFQLVLHCLRWWYSTSFALCFRDDSSIQWRQVLCLCSCLLREGCCWFEGQDHGSQLPEHVPPWSEEGSVCWVSSVLLSGRERNKSQLGMFLVVTVTLLLWLWSRSVHHEEYYIQSWGGGFDACPIRARKLCLPCCACWCSVQGLPLTYPTKLVEGLKHLAKFEK